MDEIKEKDSNYRLNVKRNFKGEKGYEFTVRGDSITELTARAMKVEEVLKLSGLESDTKFSDAHKIIITSKVDEV